jgi:hypothetical protein
VYAMSAHSSRLGRRVASIGERDLVACATMSEPEVLGAVLVGFQMSSQLLQLGLGADLERLCEGVTVDKWYPLSQFQRICGLITSTFPTSGPVFERMGVENSRMVYNGADSFKHMRGVEFLRHYISSYVHVVRGPAETIGGIEVVAHSESDGTLVVKSTSIFPRDYERGFYIGGLGHLSDVAFVNVVTDYATNLHHIEIH